MATRLYEVFGLRAKLLRDREQVGLVSLEETQQRGEKRWLRRSAPELLSPDSGQIDEPLRPTLLTKRCR